MVNNRSRTSWAKQLCSTRNNDTTASSCVEELLLSSNPSIQEREIPLPLPLIKESCPPKPVMDGEQGATLQTDGNSNIEIRISSNESSPGCSSTTREKNTEVEEQETSSFLTPAVPVTENSTGVNTDVMATMYNSPSGNTMLSPSSSSNQDEATSSPTLPVVIK